MPKSFSINITSKGKHPLQWIRRVNDKIHFEFQQRLVELAQETVDNMRNTIINAKKRPTLGNNLENTIDYELLETTGGVVIGIGNIDRLKTKAPYFEILNSGGYIPYSTAKGAPLGKFAPGTPQPSAGDFRAGNWQAGKGKFFMKPKKPIEGINYIDINAIKLTAQIEREIQILSKEY